MYILLVIGIKKRSKCNEVIKNNYEVELSLKSYDENNIQKIEKFSWKESINEYIKKNYFVCLEPTVCPTIILVA